MPIALREDFDARSMRIAAKRAKDAAQARRLLALAAIEEGASREKAAEIGGVTRQIVRDRMLKFNADGPEWLINRKAQYRVTIDEAGVAGVGLPQAVRATQASRPGRWRDRRF
jgi:hypothetical protein